MSKYPMDVNNNIFSNFISPILPVNESSFSAYDYLYDSNDNNATSSQTVGGPQQLAIILQQLFFKMADNKTSSKTHSNAPSMNIPLVSTVSYETILPSSKTQTDSFYLLSLISLWFVLIINPIVIFFGVTGNLLATYILIRCNIAKLPVSFYTIMLNISDTLNLLIPVLIFWLDNCINRTPERGYFRDRSNFLCKALMCPDQLFAALSAWYMCAISFNRWYSVCRPSSYFFRTAANNLLTTTSFGLSYNTANGGDNSHTGHKDHSATSKTNQLVSSIHIFCLPLRMNTKFRRHLQAFRSIGLITLMGILACLYPIFMHELRPIISTNEHVFDLKKKVTHTYTIVWKRCYYSQKHEYAYDIIGIILSCLLHILPLTFVAAMNIMIIVRLRQRQKLMTVSANFLTSQNNDNNQTKKLIEPKLKPMSYTNESNVDDKQQRQLSAETILSATRKDQSTSTDLPLHLSTRQTPLPLSTCTPRRHHSRDRTITIMLVSVALSYLILTLPYRLFWSYNVYIKRMHPEKLTSSVYLLQMHYIDHVLRTIRNIHYGTNFVFFIFLSKTFRRKFRQIFIEKFFQKTHRLFHHRSTINSSKQIIAIKSHHQRRTSSKHHSKPIEPNSRTIFNETPSILGEIPVQPDEITPIIELEHFNLSRYDGEFCLKK